MASAKTWIWVIVGFIAVCVLALFGVAGAGVYFVSQHIDLKKASSADAQRQFEDARRVFQDQTPLIELDAGGHPRQAREPHSLPTSAVKPTDLVILAWDPMKERTVRVALPFWLLRMGRQKIDVLESDRSFDIQRLNLDIPELERIGPAFLIDYRTPSGERVLVWTQ